MLCSVEHYQIITNDSATAVDLDSISDTLAQNLLEEALGRKGLLEWGSHTETLRVYPDGTVYPTCTPIDSATTWTLSGDVLYGVAPDPTGFDMWVTIPPNVATVVYQGGYGVADGIPARNATPQCIIDDIAWVALDLLQASPSSQFPVGATAVRSGDQAVTFRDPVTNRLGVVWSTDTLRYRRA